MTIERRNVLKGALAAGMLFALPGALRDNEAFAAAVVEVVPGSPLKNPARPGCYFIDFEVCNTGDARIRFNGVQVLWPKNVKPDPAPQPVADQALGWNPVGSTTEEERRIVSWAAVAPVTLEPGECTQVRLEFCCERPKKIRMVDGGTFRIRNGSKVLRTGATKVPKCG